MSHLPSTTYSGQVIHGEYYPHIDGIRALAVLPVVLFHVLAALCPGGYAGVDVFFVVSGYLITGGIIRDLHQDGFTIRNFYYRRIRRIMPAYFVMIAGVCAVGCALYYVTPLMALGDTVVASTLFVANLHFWMQGGDYFAPNLHSQALLHLWSLSVEEQFYLFIPLICAILWKFCRRLIVPALALLAVFSLVGAIYAVMHSKQSNAFYFLHYRAWELLIGSLLALLPTLLPTKPAGLTSLPTEAKSPVLARVKEVLANPKIRRSVLASMGLMMVLIPYVIMSSKTPFPGAAALPPVIGTALLIRYGQSGWVSRLLSIRSFVGTGKISYSLYLWHWPVTVFWKYTVFDQLYYYDYLGMFLLSLLLGYLSWRFVEVPVRTSSFWTMRRTFAFATTGIVFLVTLGTTCVFCKGWPTVLHAKANELAGKPSPQTPFLENIFLAVMRHVSSDVGYDCIWLQKSIQRRQFVDMLWGGDGGSSIGASGQPDLFLLGDSHAGSLRYGMDAVLRQNELSGYAVSCSGTDMFHLENHKVQAALKRLAEMPQASQVVLAEMWNRSFASRPKDLIYTRLEEFCIHIKSMGKTVVIVTDVPSSHREYHDIEARREIVRLRPIIIGSDSHQQSEMEYDQMQGEINLGLESVCKKTGSIFVPLHLAFKQGRVYTFVDVTEGRLINLYRDASHLSEAGSLRAAHFIMSYLVPETF